ncbi:DEAD/DEAH box helicase [bacterium]|nr:DEAD/DEAH box helicase [bacterium]
MKNAVVKISVRDLVQSVLNSGDGNFGFISPNRALEGIMVHKLVQESREQGYRKEVPVAITLKDTDIDLEIHGRIDGVYQNDTGTVIEEIKSTRRPLSGLDTAMNSLHLAQAQIYAYIFATQQHLDEVHVHLTYYHLDTGDTRTFEEQYRLTDLSVIFNQVTGVFLDRSREFHHWQIVRDRSIRDLTFPFPAFRKGQEVLIDEVAQAVAGRYKLIAQAPTGLGKTLATLFPAIKSMVDGTSNRIFYLTARTPTREAAENALELLKQNGLRLKSITLTAKDKICFKTETYCEPDYCEYIAGYYDRLNDAIRDIFSNDRFPRERVVHFAEKHRICPFEFSLDLSLLCDCIICDYNYLFDPRVFLTRFFNTASNNYVFLVDEAHNLVERSRDMFSASLQKKDFLDLTKVVDKSKDNDLYQALKALNTYLLETRKTRGLQEVHFAVEPEVPLAFIDRLEDFIAPAEAILSGRQDQSYRDRLLDLYYQAMFFIKIFRMAGQSEAFVCTFEQKNSNVRIKLLCLDPSQMIGKATAKSLSTIFFSATLMPEDYFFNLFGAIEGTDQSFQLESPFPPENLNICLIDSISTKYRFRQHSYDDIAAYLSVFVSQKKGNYLIYFPSFNYLHEVYERFKLRSAGLDLFKQERAMSETERDRFLENYTEKRGKSLVSFVVSGGIFGESIDLPGEQLIGVAIIGVGLPQINQERDLIRHYFESHSGSGFHYAYTYPGMNRVLQAAGRLIRTATDRGALLLIDDRFASTLYRRLFPSGWADIHTIRSEPHLAEVLQSFWNHAGM